LIGMKYKLIIFYYFWFLTKDADIHLDARGDLGAIQSHSFLRNRDWGAVEERQMEPPDLTKKLVAFLNYVKEHEEI